MAKNALFTPAERVEMLEEACRDWDNVTVTTFRGLLVDFCAAQGATVISKGVRSVGDLGFELQMAQMNAHLTGVETVFVTADPQFGFVSSSLVKEVAAFGGDVSGLVPDFVLEPLTTRLAQSTD